MGITTCAFPGCTRGTYSSRCELCRQHREQDILGAGLRPIAARGTKAIQPCNFPNCVRDAYSTKSDLCRQHQIQRGVGQELRPIKTRDGMPPPVCRFNGCVLLSASKGLCQSHGRQRDAGKQLRPLKHRLMCPNCPHPAWGACEFLECTWRARTHGLCYSHGWQRDRGRRLTPLQPKARKGQRTKLEQARLRQHRRRERTEASDTRLVTLRDWRQLIDRYDGLCAYCHERPATDQDHIIPVSRGGRYSIGNLLPACRSCNSSKGSKLLVEWRGARGCPLVA